MLREYRENFSRRADVIEVEFSRWSSRPTSAAVVFFLGHTMFPALASLVVETILNRAPYVYMASLLCLSAITNSYLRRRRRRWRRRTRGRFGQVWGQTVRLVSWKLVNYSHQVAGVCVETRNIAIICHEPVHYRCSVWVRKCIVDLPGVQDTCTVFKQVFFTWLRRTRGLCGQEA